MIEDNIQRQQDELRQIQEELQRVQGHSLQVGRETIGSHSAVATLRSRMSCLDFILLTVSPSGGGTSCNLSDVPAERSRGTEPGLHPDGAGQRGAAGGDVQHAGPVGIPGAPAEHHTAATRHPASVPAANTPPGPELSSHAGRTSSRVHAAADSLVSLLNFPSGSLRFSPSARLSRCSRSRIRSRRLSTTR